MSKPGGFDPQLLRHLNYSFNLKNQSYKLHTAKGHPEAVQVRVNAENADIEFHHLGVHYFQTMTRVPLTDIRTYWRGHKSPNFVRTSKYIENLDPDDIGLLFVSFVGKDGESIIDLEFSSEEQCFIILDEIEILLEIQEDPSPPPLPQQSGLTHYVYKFMYNKYMDKFILSCIVMSVLIMAASSPVGMQPELQEIFDVMEWVFSIVFSVEAVLRIIALEGVVSYLRNPWNVLDFVIVMIGWVTLLPFMTSFKFTAFRAFRALRALRTMKYLQGLRMIVDTFMHTLRMMSQALVVYAYFILLFATLGIQVFGGVFANRCVVPNPAAPVPAAFAFNSSYSVAVPEKFCLMSGPLNLSENSEYCPMSQACAYVGNPNGGYISFDSIGPALLTTMQLSGRAGGMSRLLNAVATTVSPLTALYFIAVLLFLNYLLLSLFIAIVRVSFMEIRKKEKIALAKKKADREAKELLERGLDDADVESVVDIMDEHVDEEPGYLAFDEDDRSQWTCRRRVCHRIITFSQFENMVSTAIMLNCISLSMEYHMQPLWYKEMLDLVEIVFTGIFLVEMCLKMVGLGGPMVYLRSDKNWRWNCFDFVIVMLTCVDLALTQSGTGELINISFLRVFRLLRVVRVLRRNPEVFRIINAILGSLMALWNLLLFLLVIMTLFAILGMQLFGGQWGSPPPRSHFDNFPFAMLTLFGSFSGGDKWNTLVAGMKGGDTAAFANPFFFTYDVIASYISLNFLVVIIMSNFAPKADEIHERRHERNKEIEHRMRAKFAVTMDVRNPPRLVTLLMSGSSPRRFSPPPSPIPQERNPIHKSSSVVPEPLAISDGVLAQNPRVRTSDSVSPKPVLVAQPQDGDVDCAPVDGDAVVPAAVDDLQRSSNDEPRTAESKAEEREGSGSPVVRGNWTDGDTAPRKLASSSQSDIQSSPVVAISDDTPGQNMKPPKPLDIPTHPPDMMSVNSLDTTGSFERMMNKHSLIYNALVPRFVSVQTAETSLFYFKLDHPFRMKCHTFVERPKFETFIIICIVISSGFLALENPVGVEPTLAKVMAVADYTFLVVFSVEFFMKVVAYGFVLNRESYLADHWNRLDLVVLIITFVSMFGGGSSVGRTLRVGRILRPLRMINRNEGMKVIVNALLRSLPAVFYAVVLLMFLFFVFAVLGLSMFKGLFFSCNDKVAGTLGGAAGCIGTYVNPSTGVLSPRVWSNPPYSFDNIFTSLRTLLEVVSLKAWMPVMRSGMDVTEYNKQPSINNSAINALFFLVFVFAGAFFMLKLFVGIIVGTFRQFSGTSLLTDRQMVWLEMKRKMSQSTPGEVPPTNVVRKMAHTLKSSHVFKPLSTCIILVHVALLAVKSTSRQDEWDQFMGVAHYVFLGFYVVELVLSIMAHGLRRFIRINTLWHSVDLMVVIVMGVVGPSSGVVVTCRALRVNRVVELRKSLKSIPKLLRVLGLSLIPMCNITLLYVMILYVYAVLGVQMFAATRVGQAEGLADFTTFTHALLTLFAILGGENWKRIMYDMEVSPPFCTPGIPTAPVGSAAYLGDCGHSFLAPVYFFSFFVFTFSIFVNLYTAIILDTYAGAFADRNQEPWSLSQEEFDHFNIVWAEFDPTTTGEIDPSRLREFLQKLGAPLGVRTACTATSAELEMDTMKFVRLRQELLWEEKRPKPSLATNGIVRRMSTSRLQPDPTPSTSNQLVNPVKYHTLLELLVLQLVPADCLDITEVISRGYKAQYAREGTSALMIQAWSRNYLKRKRIAAELEASGQSAAGSSIMARLMARQEDTSQMKAMERLAGGGDSGTHASSTPHLPLPNSLHEAGTLATSTGADTRLPALETMSQLPYPDLAPSQTKILR